MPCKLAQQHAILPVNVRIPVGVTNVRRPVTQQEQVGVGYAAEMDLLVFCTRTELQGLGFGIQPGAWALEKSLARPLFFRYFREVRKKRSHWPGSQSAQRLYNSYNLWRYTTRRISLPATDLFFAYKTVVLGLFKLNIKARHKIPEFLNTNIWLIGLITFNIDWSWNIFTWHNFCSIAQLEKVRTDNLKFRTDLRNWVMDGWSVTQ